MNKKYIVPILVLILGIFMHVDSYFIDPPNFLNILGRIVGGGLCGGAVCQMLIIRRENKKISENRISGVNLTKFKLTKHHIIVALIFLLSLFLISSAIFVKPIIGILSLIIGLLSSFYVFFRLFDFAYNENKKKSSLSLFNCTGVYSMGVDYARGIIRGGEFLYQDSIGRIIGPSYNNRIERIQGESDRETRELIERERERIQGEYEQRERERGRRERDLYLNTTSATYRQLTDYQDRLRRDRESNYNEDLRMRIYADQIRAASLGTTIITASQVYRTTEEMNSTIERYRNIIDSSTGIPSSMSSQPESSKSITPANKVKILPKVEPPVVIKVSSAIDQLEVL